MDLPAHFRGLTVASPKKESYEHEIQSRRPQLGLVEDK